MSQNSSNQFVGGYVTKMVDVLAAALIARQNAVLIGAPGYGKTRVALSFAHQTVGADHTSVTRLHPAAPPDVFMGALDPVAFTQGRISRVVTGTPYDPDCHFAIIDEFSRANEAAFDAMLDVADRLDTDDAPSLIATANFPPTGERTKALLDRFAFWCWVNPGDLDAKALASQRLSAYSGGRAQPNVDVAHLPTSAQLQTIWQATPGPNAIRAVSDFVDALKAEAKTPHQDANGNPGIVFMANPRRLAQWTDILFRLGMWHSQMDPDFSVVPDAAAKMLIYAWPAQDENEATQWAQVALSIVDTVAAAIDKVTADVLRVMEKIVREKDMSKRGLLVMEAVQAQMQAENTMKALADKDDPRVVAAQERMRGWMGKATNNQPLE